MHPLLVGCILGYIDIRVDLKGQALSKSGCRHGIPSATEGTAPNAGNPDPVRGLEYLIPRALPHRSVCNHGQAQQ